MPDWAGQLIDHFQIRRQLSQSEVATTYEALDENENDTVAFIAFHAHLAEEDQFRRAFLAFAEKLTTLDHPAIMAVYSYGYVDECLYLVTELPKGITLQAHLDKLRADNKRVEFDTISSFGRQVAEGLHYAHQQGVVHFDVQPANILVQGTSLQPRLINFGIARLAESVVSSVLDVQISSYTYLSPEQTQSQKVDHRSDIYSLGVVLFELCAGNPPYAPKNMNEAVRMISREPLPKLSSLRPNLPVELDKIVNKCLERDPNNRFQTAGELARALANVDVASAASTVAAPRVSNTAPSTRSAINITPSGQRDNGKLLDRSEMKIGRDEKCDIWLVSKKISRQHAKILRLPDGRFQIMDLGSDNGTYLNGTRLQPNQAVPWEASWLVRIGEYQLKLEAAPEQIDPYKTGLETDYPDDNRTRLEDPPPPPAAPLPTNTHQRPPIAPTNPNTQRRPSAQTQRPLAASAPAMPSTASTPPSGTKVSKAAERRPQKSTVPPTEPAPNVPTDGAQMIGDEIVIALQNSTIVVNPGQQASLIIEIKNQGRLVDHFKVQVVNLPAGWYTLPQTPLYLMPGTRGTTQVIFNPPRQSDSTAGAHPFDIRVTTQTQSDHYALAQGTLQISPFYSFGLDVHPMRLKGRGKALLTLTNTGNAANTYSLKARDREDELAFVLGDPFVQLGPGEVHERNIQVKPKQRPLFGVDKRVGFDLGATATDATRTEQKLSPELIIWPYVSVILISTLMALLALCSGLAIFASDRINQVRFASAQTATANFTPSATISPTPTITPTPTQTPLATTVGTNGEYCDGSPPTQLKDATWGRINDSNKTPNILRQPPEQGSKLIGDKIVSVAVGQLVQIDHNHENSLICADIQDSGSQSNTKVNVRFYWVIYNGQSGYMAEGIKDEYYLLPDNGPAATPSP